MFDPSDIPSIQHPSLGSIIAFLLVILWVVLWFMISAYRSGGSAENEKQRYIVRFSAGLFAWLALGAALPMSGLLHLKILPPPGLVFACGCFVAGIVFAFSKTGARLTTVPIHWFVGFQAFRLPLELVLHHWYKTETIPIQMTFEGYNFDIATGILAIAIGTWAKFGTPPKFFVWVFNLIGLALLLAVVSIAITSVPTPIRQFTNEPALVLPFYFPYSYIVSIAVTGALVGHLLLFRKLTGACPQIQPASSN